MMRVNALRGLYPRTLAITLPRMIGLLLLTTAFPRPLGDGGNPASWAEPIRVHRLRGARVANLITGAPLPAALFAEVVAAANALAAAGARCVTTSCGFFAATQSEIAPLISVPFISSSLCLIRHFLETGVDIEAIGVLTFDAQKLGSRHYQGVNAPLPAAQKGLFPSNIIRKCIENDETSLDLGRAQAEVVECAQALKREFPRVTHLILECTNLAPYRAAMESATGMRTFDIRDAVERLCPKPL